MAAGPFFIMESALDPPLQINGVTQLDVPSIFSFVFF